MQTRLYRISSTALGLLALACSGSSAHMEPLPPAPEPHTRATLAGPLCEPERCRCRPDDASAGEPAEGSKRYELRISSIDSEAWATVDGMVLYKGNERGTECFYVDLQPGAHAVDFRVASESGFGATFTISEMGGEGPWWYDTFSFSCGAPGHCKQGDLKAWKQGMEQQVASGSKHEGGKLDPCGSTVVRGLAWQSGRLPDMVHPAEILVELTLRIYEFKPEHAPGDDACDG